LRALEPDLLGALDELRRPDLLSIVSTGASASEELARHVLPTDARLQAVLGGARQALNARILSWLVGGARSGFLLPQLRRRVRRLSARAPEMRAYDRTPRTDEQVRKFIRTRLRRDSGAARTPLLREFRDCGSACEQSRFAELFREVKREIYGKA